MRAWVVEGRTGSTRLSANIKAAWNTQYINYYSFTPLNCGAKLDMLSILWRKADTYGRYDRKWTSFLANRVRAKWIPPNDSEARQLGQDVFCLTKMTRWEKLFNEDCQVQSFGQSSLHNWQFNPRPNRQYSQLKDRVPYCVTFFQGYYSFIFFVGLGIPVIGLFHRDREHHPGNNVKMISAFRLIYKVQSRQTIFVKLCILNATGTVCIRFYNLTLRGLRNNSSRRFASHVSATWLHDKLITHAHSNTCPLRCEPRDAPR